MASPPSPAQETREPGGAEGGWAENYRTTAEYLKGDQIGEQNGNSGVKVLIS